MTKAKVAVLISGTAFGSGRYTPGSAEYNLWLDRLQTLERFNGRTFTSPSLAGAAAVNRRSCNGWTFWEYEATPGHWLKLDTLRK